MKQTEILIEDIEYKLKKLVEQKKQLAADNKELEKQVNELKQELKDKENNIKDLERQVETIRLSKSLTNNENVHSVHQRIDELVREIDKSIGLLNNSDINSS